MTSPFFYIEPVRTWLWKHEMAEVFCISRITLWDWLKRLDQVSLLDNYHPMCRKMNAAQIKQVCELLDYPYSACLDKMNQEYIITKMTL